MNIQKKLFRSTLYTSVAMACLMAAPAYADSSNVESGAVPINMAVASSSEATSKVVEENNRYALRLMTQIYDGVRDLSHTQMLGFGRIRKGNRSITQFDFGDGTVVIEGKGGLSASRFMNISPTEKGVIYNYDTKRISGDSEIANFHNRYVRPWLGKGPDLDSNADWSTKIPLSSFGVAGVAGNDVAIKLSREYFTHEGKSMVLVHYAIPAFAYDSRRKRVIQWGRGISLTDPSFSTIYLNSTLHRAVVRRDGSAGRPVRYARTMVAANPDGSAMVDYRTVPELQQYIEDFFSADAMRVVAVNQGGAAAEEGPLTLAKNMDVLAMSVGEDGANDVPITSAAQASSDRGQEILSTSGAKAATQGQGVINASSSGSSGAVVPHEMIDIQTSGGARAGDTTEDEFVIPPETLDRLRQSEQNGRDDVSEAFDRVRGGGGEVAFGNQGDDQNSKSNGVVEDAGNVNKGSQVITVVKGGSAAIGTSNLVKNLQSVYDGAVESSTKLTKINQQLQSLESEVKKLPLVAEYSREIKTLQSRQKIDSNALTAIEKNLERLANRIDQLTAAGDDVPSNLQTQFDDLLTAQKQTFSAIADRSNALESALKKPGGITMVPDISVTGVVETLVDFDELKGSQIILKNDLDTLGRQGNALLQTLANGNKKLFESLSALGNSKLGKFLDGLGHLLNANSVRKSLSNSYTAATTNVGTGQLPPLTRDYNPDGSTSFAFLALDLASLAGNAYTLNIKGFYSDFTALTLGTFTDAVIAYKGVTDVEAIKAQTAKDALYIQEQETRRVIEEMEEFDKKWASRPQSLSDVVARNPDPYSDGYNQSNPNVDPETGLPKPGYWAYLKKNHPGTLASYGIDPEAPVGGWPDGVGPENRPQATAQNKPPKPTPTTDDGGPGYPTAPRVIRTADSSEDGDDYSGPPPSILSEQQLADIERERRRLEAKEALDAYQKKILAEKKADKDQKFKQPGSYKFRTTRLETSELIVSQFDIEPVVFTEVVSDPAVFDKDRDLFDEDGNLKKVGPDDFVMTPFDPPEISKFPPTDPDDLDGYPGTGEYPALGLDSISGSATEPDLARWEEWLATQDIRKLEQLARAAGFPSLAFALANAERIIRDSQNSGYRGYANRGPNCAGYTGCTGSVGPWKIAYATVKLGDILAQSRGIFSTGGFSDIGISGFNLMYALRDFGIQDGDLIDVEISQFGRQIFALRGHFLLTAGSPFNVRLRQGVAQMVITAINEGSASPNTAEITIKNVVRGDARQTYSLKTGQTATLRIESGATK